MLEKVQIPQRCTTSKFTEYLPLYLLLSIVDTTSKLCTHFAKILVYGMFLFFSFALNFLATMHASMRDILIDLGSVKVS